MTTTFPATEGVVAQDSICPQQDQDYWQITGAGGPKKLLNVNLEYDKLSSIQLEADVYGPRGRCMPNALTTCTGSEASSPCTGTISFCDTARGACRSPSSPICYDNTNCSAGEQCYSETNPANYELLGQVQLPASSDLKHKLNANYPAFEQGNYIVVVYDHTEKTIDSLTDYALTVTEQVDVDENEPNDAQNQATVLTNKSGVEGAMSYVGDIDWFTIEPAAGSPNIIKVTLTYPATATIAPSWTVIQGSGTSTRAQARRLSAKAERRRCRRALQWSTSARVRSMCRCRTAIRTM